MKSIHLSQFKHIDMKLTQEIIDQIQEAMLHTNLKGEINWKDGHRIGNRYEDEEEMGLK